MAQPIPVPVEIPTDITDLNAAWLTDLMVGHGHDVRIVGVDAQPVGTGQMAGSYRLSLRYHAPTHLPPTMVAKLATGPIEQREFGAGAFRNEIRFYRDLAPTFQVPIPALYGAVCSAGGTEFVLLLEDIADGTQGDQIAGCDAAAVGAVAVAAAGLHGPRWDDGRLLDDFPLPTDDDRALMDSILEPMVDAFRDRFPLDAAQSATVDWVVRDAGEWLTAPTDHVALIHGDLRVDNVMFRSSGAVSILDWQTITTGNPLRDIAFLLSTSLVVDDRRRHERAIIADYHRALVDHGVDGYSLDECWRDYVANLIQAPLIIVFGAGAAQPTERGDAMFLAMLDRVAAAVGDLDPGRLR